MSCCKRNAVYLIIIAVAALTMGLGIFFGFRTRSESKRAMGSVVSNGEGCADIGGNMLTAGGSAVDAAIATLICEGVMLPHSMGIGGGFIATIYTKETDKVETLIARETAPAAAEENMFVKKEITGAIAAAIPSEVIGYWELHQRHGKLPWHVLFQPTISLCYNGVKVSKYLGNVLEANNERIINEPSMAEIFINPETGVVYKEGEIMYRRKLGETLSVIAREGPQCLYGGGKIGKMLIEDIQEMGGIITEEDLANYRVRWEEPIKARFTNGYTLYTTPLPSSGTVLAFILNVMETMYHEDANIYWQRVVETFKHAYGHRTNLGDPHFEPEVYEILQQLTDPAFALEIRNLISDNSTHTDMEFYGGNFHSPEDHGTANINVLAPNGDGISVTSTVNSHFGAKVRSRQTGIILNDEMDDFSTPGVINAYGIPASPANFIKPGKRPMSSMCPSIVLNDKHEVQLLVGGAGGSKITTSVAQTILRYFVLNDTIADSLNLGRVHHQLAPMWVDVEPEVPQKIKDYLMKVGHELFYLPENKAFSALTAIGLKNGHPEPVCDRRRMGSSVVITAPQKQRC